MNCQPLPQGHALGPPPPEVKPRLSKEQHELLERHFQGQNKPNTATKKGIADNLGVPLDKINVGALHSPTFFPCVYVGCVWIGVEVHNCSCSSQNWFQNRRAKVKQDLKRQQNLSSSVHAQLAQTSLQMHYAPSSGHVLPQPHQQEPHSSDDMAGPSLENAETVNLHQLGYASSASPDAAQESAMLNSCTTSQPMLEQGSMLDTGMTSQSMLEQGATAQSMDQLGFSMQMSQEPQFAQEPVTSSGGYGFAAGYDSGTGYTFPSGFDGSIDYEAMLAGNSVGYQAYTGIDGMPMQTPTPLLVDAGADNSSPDSVALSGSDTVRPSGSPQWSDGVTYYASDHSDAQCNDFSEESLRRNFESQHSPQGPLFAYDWSEEKKLPDQSDSNEILIQMTADSYGEIPAPAGLDGSQSPVQLSPVQPSPDDDQPGDMSSMFARRNSATSALADSMHNIGIHAPQPVGAALRRPSNANLAARRQRPGPPVLLKVSSGSPDAEGALHASGAQRSASYSAALPTSPGQGLMTDHVLRRVRSSGISKLQKSNPGSAQRSPLNPSFSDASGPKAMRQLSSHVSGSAPYPVSAASAAPPTPLSPDEMARLPQMLPDGVSDAQPVAPQPVYAAQQVPVDHFYSFGGIPTTVASPPGTPMGVAVAGPSGFYYPLNPIYRDTPPQSAPASQQCFPTLCLPPQHPPLSGPEHVGELFMPENLPAHYGRPPVPAFTDAPAMEPQIKGAVGPMPMFDRRGVLQLEMIPFQYPSGEYAQQAGGARQVRIAPDVYAAQLALLNSAQGQQPAVSDLTVHQYTPPPGAAEAGSNPRPRDSQPKNYIFANQGPNDFQSQP